MTARAFDPAEEEARRRSAAALRDVREHLARAAAAASAAAGAEIRLDRAARIALFGTRLEAELQLARELERA